jgi:hypothetical protein
LKKLLDESTFFRFRDENEEAEESISVSFTKRGKKNQKTKSLLKYKKIKIEKIE